MVPVRALQKRQASPVRMQQKSPQRNLRGKASSQFVRTIATLPLATFRTQLHHLSLPERKLLARELEDSFGFANGLPQTGSTNKIVRSLSRKMKHLESTPPVRTSLQNKVPIQRKK